MGVDMRGRSHLRETPALDRGEALADPVDLHDVGPAGQELVRHGDEVVQRHAVHRALEERRC